MKATGAGLLWLASITGAAAYFPVDIENHARWVVLDGLPVLASGQSIRAEVTSLRTNDIATQPALVSAVCGTLDFHNTDDGTTNFVLFYSVDDDGKMAVIGRPFLYGRLSGRNSDPQFEAASTFCENPSATAVVAGAAVITATGTAAETDAAAVATRP